MAEIAEGLLCGVTTVANHHLTWPRGIDSIAVARATADAAAQLGGRQPPPRPPAAPNPTTPVEPDAVAVPLSGNGLVRAVKGRAGGRERARTATVSYAGQKPWS